MVVSLRLPASLRERVARLAAAREQSPHALMLEAIGEKLDAEEARVAFREEAHRRLEQMKRTGKGIPADAVFDYLEARIAGRKAVRPRARKQT